MYSINNTYNNTDTSLATAAEIASGTTTDTSGSGGSSTQSTEGQGTTPSQTSSTSVEALATGEATFNQTNQQLSAVDRYRQGDDSAASEVLAELEETINKAISAYAGGDPQMRTPARIAALEAVKTYDPTKGTQLSTYVYGQLRRLQRVSAQRANLTYIPENVALERKMIQQKIREYVADNGVEPTTEQLADLTGLSVQRIDAVMNYKPVVPDSAATSPEGDSLVANNSNHALNLYDRLIYDELDPIDKKIYEWTTGFGTGEILPQVEIARRLGISPAAVSKRYKNIVAKFARDRELVRALIGVGDTNAGN